MGNMKSICILAIAATGIALAAPAQAEKYPKLQKEVLFSPSADHSGEAASLVWVNKPGGAKGVTKVVIPFFQVQFVTDSDTSASTVGGANSDMTVRMEGPSDAQMQAITDRLYAKFLADIAAAGLTVVPTDQAKAFPSYAKLQAGGKPSGTAVDGLNGVNSKFFSPTGLAYYYLPTQDVQYTGGGRWTNMETSQLPLKEQALMAESGAAVLGFRAVVDFASLKSSNKNLFGRWGYSATTKAKTGLAIRPIATQLWLMTPGAKPGMMDPTGRMRLEIQAPLLIESNAITAVTNANTTGDRVGLAAANVLGALTGSGSYSSKKFNVTVEPTAWERDVEGALNGVETVLVTRLKGEL